MVSQNKIILYTCIATSPTSTKITGTISTKVQNAYTTWNPECTTIGMRRVYSPFIGEVSMYWEQNLTVLVACITQSSTKIWLIPRPKVQGNDYIKNNSLRVPILPNVNPTLIIPMVWLVGHDIDIFMGVLLQWILRWLSGCDREVTIFQVTIKAWDGLVATERKCGSMPIGKNKITVKDIPTLGRTKSLLCIISHGYFPLLITIPSI